jgi:sigma-B regulation protein RsbU (phosphoserine phosphatase)
MLLALWDDEARTLTISNAGSVQPLLVTRQGSLTDALDVRTIAVEGFPLGLFPHAAYDEMTLHLAPSDLVVFFSDGITDAINSRGVDFGSQSLKSLLQHHPTASSSAHEAVQAILEAVTTHQAGAEHFDDETLVALRVR